MPKKVKKVLVVDDSPVMQKVSTKILQSDGYEVINAWEGEECLKIAKTESLDAIIMDVILPDGDGREVVRKLKHDSATEGIPIIFSSNTVKVEDDKGFESINVDGTMYRAFAKPLHHPRFLSSLRKEINRHKHGGKLPKMIIEKT